MVEKRRRLAVARFWYEGNSFSPLLADRPAFERREWRRGREALDATAQESELRAVIDWLGSDYFAPGEHGAFSQLHGSLVQGGDPYKVLADFRGYSDCQVRVDAAYRDQSKWARMAILNTARMGKFSSDRTIREYAADIWSLKAVAVE